MREEVVHIFFFFLTLSQGSSGCNLWCRKPMSFEYFCCEDGNPFTDSRESSSTTQESTISSQLTAGADKISQVTEVPLSCRYFCIYGSEKVYCCDDGSQPIPDNHKPHEGRCASKKEQVCKKGGIYLHVHARKVRTITGGMMLSAIGTAGEPLTCASDGYCPEHEKCCENRCSKKHTCMRSVFDYDGTKRAPTKKKSKQTKTINLHLFQSSP